jgi:hypothetical protein
VINKLRCVVCCLVGGPVPGTRQTYIHVSITELCRTVCVLEFSQLLIRLLILKHIRLSYH